MEDYRQTHKEYQRLRKEILEKRRAKMRERIRRVMKRMERAPNQLRRARTRPIDPARHLNDFRTDGWLRSPRGRPILSHAHD